MTSVPKGTIWAARICGLLALILGILFWTGERLSLVPLHMALGTILVIALWILAAKGARAGVSGGLVAIAVIWGLLVPVLGALQVHLMPGPGHWVIQVIHLLLGIGAMGLAEGLAGRIRRSISSPPK